MRAYSGVCLRAVFEVPWEHIVMQAGSVFESVLGTVLESIL